MSNRINPVDQGMIGEIGEKLGEAAGAKKVGGNETAVGKGTDTRQSTGDTVELTSDAKLLERLDKTLAELSSVDTQRIDAVRNAIENGDYVIDAEKIAEAMTRLDRELGE